MRATNVRMALLAGLTVVVMACSGSDEATSETLPPPSSESTTTTSASTTSSTVSTTSESTTTTEQYDEVETAVRAAHTRVMTELFAYNEVAEGPEARLELLEELAVDPFLSRAAQGIQARLESGQRAVGPGYASNIVEVTIDGELARVLDCSLDQAVVYDADGEVVIPMADTFKLRTSQLRLIGGRWMLEDVFAGGDERCDPADYS
jgi:hypothetical protein